MSHRHVDPLYFVVVDNGILYQYCLKDGGLERAPMNIASWIIDQGYQPIAAISNPEDRICKVLCTPRDPKDVSSQSMLLATISLGKLNRMISYKLVPMRKLDYASPVRG